MKNYRVAPAVAAKASWSKVRVFFIGRLAGNALRTDLKAMLI